MEMDAKESMLMVIRAIETDAIDRVEDIVGRLIDLLNSDESREFLENKIQQARSGLLKLEETMEVSLYDGMQAMRQLVTDIRVHVWTSESAISRFQFSGQSLHYLLTHASDVLKDESLTNEEKVKKIWHGITGSLTQDEDKDLALGRLEEFLGGWRPACKLPEPDIQRVENQIRIDFDRGLRQQHSDIDDLFSQLRKHFEGLKRKLEETTTAIKWGERKGTFAGVLCGALNILPCETNKNIVPMDNWRVKILHNPYEGAKFGACWGRQQAQTEIKNRGGERFLNRKDPGWYIRVLKTHCLITSVAT